MQYRNEMTAVDSVSQCGRQPFFGFLSAGLNILNATLGLRTYLHNLLSFTIDCIITLIIEVVAKNSGPRDDIVGSVSARERFTPITTRSLVGFTRLAIIYTFIDRYSAVTSSGNFKTGEAWRGCALHRTLPLTVERST